MRKFITNPREVMFLVVLVCFLSVLPSDNVKSTERICMKLLTEVSLGQESIHYILVIIRITILNVRSGLWSLISAEACRFQPQTDPVQNRGTFFWTVISKTWPQIIKSELFFLESVTFQVRDRMLSSFSAQSLKSYGHFLDLGIVSPPCWKKRCKTNTVNNLRRRGGRHGWLTDCPSV